MKASGIVLGIIAIVAGFGLALAMRLGGLISNSEVGASEMRRKSRCLIALGFFGVAMVIGACFI